MKLSQQSNKEKYVRMSGCFLVQAFEHLRLHYLICKQCFKKAVSQYHTNTFRRVCCLGKPIPNFIIRLQKRLIRFKERQNISGQSIFMIDIVEMYTSSMSQSYELSTQFSVNTEDDSQIKNAFDYYQKYSWLKEKLWENYQYIGKQSTKYTGMAGSLMQNISQRKNQISQKVSFFKQEFHHLKKQTPSIKQLKIGSFLKSKYGKFF